MSSTVADMMRRGTAAADDPSTEAKCVKMEAFLEMHRWRRPLHRSTDPEETKLRKIWDDLVRRCAGHIGQGIKPSERKLTPQARARVERIELEITRREQSQPESATEAAPCGESKAAHADQVATEGATPDHKPSRPQRETSTDGPSKRLRTTRSRDSAAPTSSSSSSAAVTLCLRGLNIQWPFSQLILMKAKSEEVREYDLGHRKICEAGEETWIVETRGPSARSTTNAICGDLELAPRPHAAQIVGTVSFDSAHLYDNTWAAAEHCSAFKNMCLCLLFCSVFEYEDVRLNVSWLLERLFESRFRVNLRPSFPVHLQLGMFCRCVLAACLFPFAEFCDNQPWTTRLLSIRPGIAIALQRAPITTGMAKVFAMHGKWVQCARYASQYPLDQLV